MVEVVLETPDTVTKITKIMHLSADTFLYEPVFTCSTFMQVLMHLLSWK